MTRSRKSALENIDQEDVSAENEFSHHWHSKCYPLENSLLAATIQFTASRRIELDRSVIVPTLFRRFRRVLSKENGFVTDIIDSKGTPACRPLFEDCR